MKGHYPIKDRTKNSKTSITIEEAKNLLHEFWNSKSDACPLECSIQEQQEIGFENFVEEKYK